MMKKLLLFLLSLSFYNFSSAQCAEPGIYALGNYTKDSMVLIRYNPTRDSFDTLAIIEKIPYTYYYSAMDPYNGRFFFWANANSTLAKRYSHVIIDINTMEIIHSDQQFSDTAMGEMEYDMFDNTLVMRSYLENNLKGYHIASDSVYFIADVPGNGPFMEKMSAYNVIDQQYVYASPADDPGEDTWIYTYDVVKKRMAAAFPYPEVWYNHQYVKAWPGRVTYDFIAKKIIAVENPGFSNRLVSIDHLTGEVNHIANIDLANNATYPTQLASLDVRNGLYYHAYLSHGSNRWSVMDIHKGNIIKLVKGFRYTNYHQFHGAYDPICKLREDSTLVVTFGKSYQWYINGKQIPGATSQTHKPEQSGTYSADVIFSCGRLTHSNGVDVKVLINGVQFLGNPMTDQGFIVFNNPDMLEHSLDIYNSLGQIVKTYRKITTHKITIDRDAMAAGLYYYRLRRGNGLIGDGKFVVR